MNMWLLVIFTNERSVSWIRGPLWMSMNQYSRDVMTTCNGSNLWIRTRMTVIDWSMLGTDHLPSGKRLQNYGKSPFSMAKSTISMAIFNSYVKLAEGTDHFGVEDLVPTMAPTGWWLDMICQTSPDTSHVPWDLCGWDLRWRLMR